MVLTLYGGQRTRASLPRWYMEEKDISYNLIELNRQEGENLQSEFLAINPFGKLPVLIDSNIFMPNGEPLKLFESGAILLHLAEQYSDDIKTIETKALTSQWLQFVNSTLSIALLVPSHREKEFPRLMKELDHQLENNQLSRQHLGSGRLRCSGLPSLLTLVISPSRSRPLSIHPSNDRIRGASSRLSKSHQQLELSPQWNRIQDSQPR